ncbi:MAG TPA: hypothetical protein VJZ27_06355 [Aggregatilineales bacterium]|nr:hypothetical protein [Aggregatilineales bacterium]
MAGVFNDLMTGEQFRRYGRIQIARDTGWTLEYIDGLSMQNWLDYMAVRRGLADIEGFHINA